MRQVRNRSFSLGPMKVFHTLGNILDRRDVALSSMICVFYECECMGNVVSPSEECEVSLRGGGREPETAGGCHLDQ
jgi:hypothetical protein